MDAPGRTIAPARWIRTLAIYVSAILLSIMLLPAAIVGWYYADPQSFGSAIGVAIEYVDPGAVRPAVPIR